MFDASHFNPPLPSTPPPFPRKLSGSNAETSYMHPYGEMVMF